MVDRCYERISLDSAASGSIDRQHDTLAAHAGPDAVFYVDRSVSGGIPFADRPSGARLLAQLQAGDRVLVTKIDRAARDVWDLLGTVRAIKSRGASITFVAQADVVTEGPMGELLLTLLGAVAQFERALIAERRREALASFKAQGRHASGRAPYGLRSVPNTEGRGLVLRPHPEQAPLLRDAVARVLDGETQSSAAERLGMAPAALSRLLRNPRLSGEVSPGRLDSEQAVFSPVEWAALQEHLRRPDKAWTRAEGYGAALACEVCGHRLYLNVAKRSSMYRCLKTAPEHQGPDGKPGLAVLAAKADAFLESEFLGRFGRMPVLEERVARADAERIAAIGEAKLRLDAARRAQDDARTDDEDEAAEADVRAARRALRAAEALPDRSTVETVATGQTLAQAWATAGQDERVSLLLKVGPWHVAPGQRLPTPEKIYLPDASGDYLAGQE